MRKLKITTPIDHNVTEMYWSHVVPTAPYISRKLDGETVYASLSRVRTPNSKMTARKDGVTWYVEDMVREDRVDCMVLTVIVPDGGAGDMTTRISKHEDGMYSVDWGDGIVNQNRSHRYTKAGTYEIFIRGTINFDRGDDTLLNPSKVVLKYILFGDILLTGICLSSSADRVVRNHYCEITTLGDIKPTTFDPSIQNFNHAFFGCEYLKELPTTLFHNCKQVKEFKYTFFDCRSLKEVPAFLFLESIEAEEFYATFGYCTSLTGVHPYFFDRNRKVKRFILVFGKCTAFKEIPVRLLMKMKEVETLFGAFAHTAIEAIDIDVFKYNVSVKDVTRLLSDTKITNVQRDLFKSMSLIERFENTFDNCKLLKTVEDGFFDNAPLAYDFRGTFYGCTELESPAPELWTRTVDNLIGERCFSKCAKIPNFMDIPYVWRAEDDYGGGGIDRPDIFDLEVTHYE